LRVVLRAVSSPTLLEMNGFHAGRRTGSVSCFFRTAALSVRQRQAEVRASRYRADREKA
jgi:hypothetical protein